MRWIVALIACTVSCLPGAGTLPTGFGRAASPARPPNLQTVQAPVPVSLPERVGDRMMVEPTTTSPTVADVVEVGMLATSLGWLDPVWEALDELTVSMGLGPVSSPLPPANRDFRTVLTMPRWSWTVGSDAAIESYGRDLCSARMLWVTNQQTPRTDACVYPPAIMVLPGYSADSADVTDVTDAADATKKVPTRRSVSRRDRR